MNSLTHKTKPQLIAQANTIIASKYPDFTYDLKAYEITTWANSKQVVVKYRRLIRYTPLGKQEGLLGSTLDYDFEVDLTNQTTSFDTWGMDNFYIPTAEEQVKIDFVIEAFGLPHPHFYTNIIEESETYRINLEKESSFAYYVIDKTTGLECDGAIHGNYEPMPEDLFDNAPKFPDPLVEIND
ncbi:hypothetical protein [Formosa sp. PL04]|uniref:hypothetical protein n=1 Tax=Formosa sp. PL04 TaxID=3081755 RepID=UPI0029813A41|nr:hypothetical protein [Formosa sp. PL04]MDW5290814.1 hypothetical protein [Formosa sp. PL04]